MKRMSDRHEKAVAQQYACGCPLPNFRICPLVMLVRGKLYRAGLPDWHTAWKEILDTAVNLELQGAPSSAEETADLLVTQALAAFSAN